MPYAIVGFIETIIVLFVMVTLFGAIPMGPLELRQQDEMGELATLFAKANVKPGDTVVAYCHIGQQATGTLFAARLLGYNVKLYDGSFEDWSAHADFPVENPSLGSARK